MRVLLVEPGKEPVLQEINGSLKSMQEIVGGTIQALYPFEEHVALICNDEGKLLGLPFNRALRYETGGMYDVICGTFFLCGAPSDSDCFEGLTETQAEKYTKLFSRPELILAVDNMIVVITTDPSE